MNNKDQIMLFEQLPVLCNYLDFLLATKNTSSVIYLVFVRNNQLSKIRRIMEMLTELYVAET